MVNFAPRGPNERNPPDLLKFRVTPGAILIRLQKRKATSLSFQLCRRLDDRELRFFPVTSINLLISVMQFFASLFHLSSDHFLLG